jgi:hypothetical protein
MPKKFLHQKVLLLINTSNTRLKEGDSATLVAWESILKKRFIHHQEITD